MKQIYLKFLAFVVAALMLLSVVSCTTASGSLDGADTTVGNEETTAEETTTESPDGETTENADLTTETVDETALSVPDDLKLNDEISVLHWSDTVVDEFEIEEITGDSLCDEIYWRNQYTADHLEITFKWSSTKGNNSNKRNFVTVVENSYEAGDRAYDIIASYSRTMGLLSAQGLLADLAAIDNSYLDFDQPYWPSNLVENFAIDDSLYFISGDISTNLRFVMYGIFCNDDLRRTLKLESPLDIALAGEWTLSRFIEMAEGVYVDTDLDGKRSEEDTYGFDVASKLYFEQYYTAADLDLIERDADGALVVSSDYTSQKAFDLVRQLKELLNSPGANNGNGETGGGTSFREERALFIHERMLYERNYLSSYSFISIMLPCPKYDMEQRDYVTAVSNLFTLWGVMGDASADDKASATAVLEVLGYYAHKCTSPAIEEILMPPHYHYHEDGIQQFRLYEMICSGIRFDLGRVFAPELMGGQNMIDLFYQVVWNDNMDVSALTDAAPTFRRSLGQLVESYRKLKSK